MTEQQTPRADQADLRVGLSQASGANDIDVVSNDTNGIVEQTCEPDVPLTFVACIGCGSLTDLHAPTCPECQQPRPQRVPPTLLTDIRCVRCGDDEAGPWLDADDGLICEACLDEAVA